jgi:hypothetical protein
MLVLPHFRLTAYWFSPVSSIVLFGLSIAETTLPHKRKLSQAILAYVARIYIPKIPVSQKLSSVVYNAAIARKYPALQEFSQKSPGLWNSIRNYWTSWTSPAAPPPPEIVAVQVSPTEWLNVYV